VTKNITCTGGAIKVIVRFWSKKIDGGNFAAYLKRQKWPPLSKKLNQNFAVAQGSYRWYPKNSAASQISIKRISSIIGFP
jgi:hypothetical protein